MALLASSSSSSHTLERYDLLTVDAAAISFPTTEDAT
jgi:hypothetical protein